MNVHAITNNTIIRPITAHSDIVGSTNNTIYPCHHFRYNKDYGAYEDPMEKEFAKDVRQQLQEQLNDLKDWECGYIQQLATFTIKKYHGAWLSEIIDWNSAIQLCPKLDLCLVLKYNKERS